MASIDDINKRYQEAYAASGLTADKWVESDQHKKLSGELNTALGQINDINEVKSQISKIQGFGTNANYSPTWNQFLGTLTNRQTELSAPSPSPSPSPAPAPTPAPSGGMQPQQPVSATELPKTQYYAPPPVVVPHQDSGVESRVAGMLKKDSPLIQAAQADALKAANRRGLLNSTMAAQAGTRAALDVVVPIASQEAGQAHQTNLSSQGFQQEGMLQAPRIASQEKLAAQQEAGNTARLALELGSREKLAAADQAAQKERLGIQLTAQERIALDDRNAAMARLGIDINSRENISANEIAANQTSAVRDAVAQANTAYSNAYNAIMTNPNISAADRGVYLESIENRRNADMILIEGLYNVDLNWETTPTPRTTQATPQSNESPT